MSELLEVRREYLHAQLGFCFDAPPEPVAPPPARVSADAALVADARVVLASLPNDICIDDVLPLLGFEPHSIVAWHRARVIDALIADGWKAYPTNPGIRWRRL